MKPATRGWGKGPESSESGASLPLQAASKQGPFSQLPTFSTPASSSTFSSHLQPRLLILSAPYPGLGVNWLRLH